MTRKGEQAESKLTAIKNDVEEITKVLKKVREALATVPKEKVLTISTRSMVKDMHGRIDFEDYHLKFYVEFTLVASERDDYVDLKGSIVYGAKRTLCFTRCIFQEENEDTTKCNLCDRIARCDGFEDKPLIEFSVNKGGMIKSTGKLEDVWWIKEDDTTKGKKRNLSELQDLHFRALATIWKDALGWANEIILP